MKKLKKIAVSIISILVVVALLLTAQRLVMPKYAGDGEDSPLEGNFTAEYYNETTKHDVLMVGDCEVYENIDPMVLWKQYGITSYIRGNAQQLVWQSYYMLEDALRYETPKVLIYNVQSLQHGEPQRETYNRMTLDGMEWSKTKVDAISASMIPEDKPATDSVEAQQKEQFLDYVFPILRFHSRITDLNKNDFKYFADAKKVTHNGYYMRVDVAPVSEGIKNSEIDVSWLPQVKKQYKNVKSEVEEDSSDEEGLDDPFAEEEMVDPFEAGKVQKDENTKKTSDKDAEVEEDSEEDAEAEELSEEELDDPFADGELEDPFAEDGDVEDPFDEGDDTSKDKKSEVKKDDGGVQFSEYAIKYLDKMRDLCKKKGIKLVLMKAPSLEPVWHESEEAQVQEYAKKNHLQYINFYDLLEDVGIDYEEDTYDYGLHMNLNGAGKVAKYLGKFLAEKYDLEDHRSDSTLSKVYDKKYKAYKDMIEAQKKELKKYGEIRSY